MSSILNNVVDLSVFKFPIGSKAWHKKYRVCQIIECCGSLRKIKSLKLGTIKTEWIYNDVHINELNLLPEVMA